MSSFSKPNHRQPIDHNKLDHMELVESLRRWELKLIYQHHATIRDIKHFEETGQHFCTTEGHPGSVGKEGLYRLSRTLFELMWLLCRYYEYPEGYSNIICHNKEEYLPIRPYDNRYYHDGFWGSDPTKE